MKKIMSIVLAAILFLILVISLSKNLNDGISFKMDYESLNGKTNSNGKKHRNISIDKNNKFVEITPKELVDKIDKKETFYVYFGSSLCPWCRSVIEKADEISRGNNITKIYYIDIWDEDGNEILRDKYELDENNKLKLIKEGSAYYEKLLISLDNVLSDYTLTDNNKNIIEVGEKRIYAPNFIYIKKGLAKKLVTGISKLQTDSREKLTSKIKKEEENIFQDFFKKAD